MSIPRLAIVVPCYKEEAVLQETTRRLSEILDNLVEDSMISSDSYIMYVNDGSTDGTWPVIQRLFEENRYVCGLNLACNVGHQNALVAGLTAVAEMCDAAISIDADLQDDVNAIREMMIKYGEGCDVVYGVRRSRESDTWFKRTTAQCFYSVMKSLGVNLVYNHADFRLMSQRAVLHLLTYRERNLFLRGMVPTIGYKSDYVYYDRAERFAGESKYPLKKMVGFAFEGITSFSAKPVHMVLYLGLLFLIISLAILIWVIYAYFAGKVVPGWSSLMLSLWFCSGCVLTGIGVLGEYIGKIYVEVKDRPRFNIEKMLIHDDE